MDVTTAWVKPPPQVGGLDHLAVQAPCINVYGSLLPGITNVTDRARYYSFYPWVIWAFDKAGFTVYDDAFIERFRRADVLYTLIAVRHAAICGDAYEGHAGATVGSSTLYSVAAGLEDGANVRLSDYSLRNGAKNRYFANKLGGLSQYYLGVLRELEVLDGDAAQGIKYTRQVGQLIAEQFDAGFDSGLFLSAVDADSVTTQQLDALSTICPCSLGSNLGEHEVLGKLFFARETFFDDEALTRRRTLQSILHLSGLLYEQEQDLSVSTFRACAYSGSLPNQDPWPVPTLLARNRAKWNTYARNEILSIAVQGLFHTLLDAYHESGMRFEASFEVVDWFVDQPEVRDVLSTVGPDQSFSKYLDGARKWLPDMSHWLDESHEVQLTERIVKLSDSNAPKSTKTRSEIFLAALQCLAALAHRRPAGGDPYENLIFDPRYFEHYPINLRSFGHHVSTSWPSLSLREVVRWLLLNWGIDIHLRVALRKLRGQSKSTFRIRPTDRGLEVIAVPPAVHTSPRFNQALRILKDLGALECTESGRWRPSAFGQAMVDLGDAS